MASDKGTTSFSGTIRLADVPASEVAAALVLEDDLIVVTSDERTIGRWKRADVTATQCPEGFLLAIEGEELIFDTDSEELILALTPPRPPPPPQIVMTPPAAAATVSPAPEEPEAPLLAPPRQRRRAPVRLSPPHPIDPSLPAAVPTEQPKSNHPQATASLSLGVAGIILALVPGASLVSVAAGAISLVLGLFSRAEIKAGRPGRDVATVGAILGAAAVILGVIITVL